jgi:hypothetical protein
LQPLFKSAQHFYEKWEESGTGSVSGFILVTNGSECGSGRPKTCGSYGSESRTLVAGWRKKPAQIYEISQMFYLVNHSLKIFLLSFNGVGRGRVMVGRFQRTAYHAVYMQMRRFRKARVAAFHTAKHFS